MKEEESVIFKIIIDLDYKNDIGSYIGELSKYPKEKEWLLPFGTEFKIESVGPSKNGDFT